MQVKILLILFSMLLTFLPVSAVRAGNDSPNKATVRYAQGFTIEYKGNYKVITVLNPWKGNESRYQYLLVQRGTPPPARYDGVPRIEVPVRSIITMSTTHLAYLDQLGLLDALVGYSTFKYVNNPKVLQRIAAGKLKEVGAAQGVNVELIMDLNPEVIITYALGSPDDEYFKLREAHLNVVLNGEYMETTPLGRAEWIKFLAAFFNKEQEAETIFTTVVTAYEAMAIRTKTIAAKPTVFLNAPFNGEWWIPGNNTYLVRFLQDAGAAYLLADDPSDGSSILAFEAIYEKAAEADYWLHPGQCNSLKGLLATDERLGQFKAFQSGRVYNNNARVNQYGGNDYWESGLTRPDIVLADLIKIFHPELVPQHEFIYYKKLE
jgi:iron complex transport system substrate-binding protein